MEWSGVEAIVSLAAVMAYRDAGRDGRKVSGTEARVRATTCFNIGPFLVWGELLVHLGSKYDLPLFTVKGLWIWTGCCVLYKYSLYTLYR